VYRIITRNEEFLPGALSHKGKKWGSAWMEVGGIGGATGSLAQPSTDPALGFLREGGYNEFPALVARWAVTSRDVYPTGPGHDALPDAKQLMALERRSLLAISKLVNPPMLIPESMRQSKLSMLPGDALYVPAGMNQKIEPALMVHHEAVSMTENKIQQTRERIASAFYADLTRKLVDRAGGMGRQPPTAE
jgi:hypothetical protein